MTTEMNTDHPYEYFTRLPENIFLDNGFEERIGADEKTVWTKNQFRLWYNPMNNKLCLLDTAKNDGEIFYMRNKSCFHKILFRHGLLKEQII